ncbi:MAG: ABC transporter ATP-binding protein [Elusimicrobia bacterium]|nr:ABC transporter ATP-binding protein [Elusimicrobiota bacterium]
MVKAPGVPAVEAKNLTKIYGQGESRVEVFQGLNFEIPEKSMIALMGPSGSGKSTLLNLLGLMDAPTGGSLKLFGKETSSMRDSERSSYRAQEVGFVFQFNALLAEFTVLENLWLSLRMSARKDSLPADGCDERERAMEWLKRWNLIQRAQHLPSQISGGEQQRVAILRALIRRPKILLADEPTGNLDKGSAEVVLKTLRDIQQELGVCIFLATHNEWVAEQAQEIWEISPARLSVRERAGRGD